MTRTIVLTFFLLLAIFLGIVFFMPHTSNAPTSLPMQQITIATTTLMVEVAHTPSQREQGLSGRTGLAEGRGMFFVFDTPGQYGFWMKDMQFPLDIIFIGQNMHVITIDSDLSPATYPQVFYPPTPALYVLEVPAGFAAEHGITQGSSLVLD